MGGGGHGIDAEIGILQGAQLPLQQNGLAGLVGLGQILVDVAHIGTDHLTPLHQQVEELIGMDLGLVIEVDEQCIFQGADVLQPGLEALFIKELVDLNAVLGIFVGIEGSNAGLGRAEGIAGQTLFLIGVLQNMVGHQQLNPVRYHQLGCRNACIGDGLDLCHELGNVQRYAVADDIHGAGVAGTGRDQVQGKLSVIVDDGVASIGAALKANDNIRGLREQVCDLAFPLVTPVGTHNCFHHS